MYVRGKFTIFFENCLKIVLNYPNLTENLLIISLSRPPGHGLVHFYQFWGGQVVEKRNMWEGVLTKNMRLGSGESYPQHTFSKNVSWATTGGQRKRQLGYYWGSTKINVGGVLGSDDLVYRPPHTISNGTALIHQRILEICSLLYSEQVGVSYTIDQKY